MEVVVGGGCGRRRSLLHPPARPSRDTLPLHLTDAPYRHTLPLHLTVTAFGCWQWRLWAVEAGWWWMRQWRLWVVEVVRGVGWVGGGLFVHCGCGMQRNTMKIIRDMLCIYSLFYLLCCVVVDFVNVLCHRSSIPFVTRPLSELSKRRL